MRLAAIDIGTNSIRCIIVATDDRGGFRVLDDEKAAVRLGEGLTQSGNISAAAWERARQALVRMRHIADGLGVESIVAVATSAVRKAANGAAFVAAMENEAGFPLRVISGEEEAELALLSASRHFDLGAAPHALVDIGGGSIEIVLTAGALVEAMWSLELGAVFLSERFLTSDPVSRFELATLRHHIRHSLRQVLPRAAHSHLNCLIGSGGTITTIGAMLMARRGERYDSLSGYEIIRSDIVHLLAMLQRTTCRERRNLPGLNPERADIIVAGVTLVDELMDVLDLNMLRINEGGIREGLIVQSLAGHGLLPEQRPSDWRDSVLRLSRACHTDEAHSRQVSQLALTLFDALPENVGLDPRARILLEAAGLLHDIGYFINYAKHHKHSFHLIRHAELFDFSPREKEIIANVARYHRKTLPKKNHENYAGLTPADRDLVCKLGGILRLADGLDRRRTQSVRTLACRLIRGCCEVVLQGEGDLAVEAHGGAKKSDLFAQAFACRVSVTVQGEGC